MEWKGLEKFRRNTRKAKRDYERASGLALYLEAEALMSESKKQCPVDFGFLRGSGYVTQPSYGKEPVVEVGYGKEYGPHVHERRGLSHPVGKDHFLSDPLGAARPGLLRRVGKRIDGLVESGSARWRKGSHPTRPK